jgi:hypothetical protein
LVCSLDPEKALGFRFVSCATGSEPAFKFEIPGECSPARHSAS